MPPDTPRGIVRRSVVNMAASMVLFAAVFVWAWDAVSPEAAIRIMLPTIVASLAFVVVVSARTILRARSATSPEAGRAFLRWYYGREILAARVFEIVTPLLLAISWGGIVALRVWRANPPLLYWAGAVAVTIALIAALVSTKKKLRNAKAQLEASLR